MDMESPVSGATAMCSSTDAGGEPGRGQHAPGSLAPGGERSEDSLYRSRDGAELLLCNGPAAPREECVCPGVLREGLGWVPAKGAGTSSAFLQIGHNDSNPNPTYLI